ncbi:MAG: PepSY-associated TM helix domain-containing protein [Steroidobacteraceae bacterium]
MAAVPGSLFRRVLFWAHLGCGITAGFFILVMSVSGVLLTYESQMVEAAARRNLVASPGSAMPLDADRIAGFARAALPKDARASLVFEANAAAPVAVTRVGESTLLLDPFDGSVIEDASIGRREFFRVVENWHRWLGGNSQGTGAKLIDYSNLLFLFLVVSGIYIWLPQVWRWRNLRGLMLFQKSYVNAKVRDFNWHHVFSFWMLLPLFVISLSGVVMSFAWANRLVYAAYGEAVPERGGQQGGGTGGAGGAAPVGATRGDVSERASLESLRQAAMAQTPDWNKMTIPLIVRGERVGITAELKTSERRPPRQTVTLSTVDASVIRVQAPQQNAQTPGQRARSWMRFAHTGEQYGIIGQTIAGIASLAACFLVYTGLALAWRRLIRPLFRNATPA